MGSNCNLFSFYYHVFMTWLKNHQSNPIAYTITYFLKSTSILPCLMLPHYIVCAPRDCKMLYKTHRALLLLINNIVLKLHICLLWRALYLLEVGLQLQHLDIAEWWACNLLPHFYWKTARWLLETQRIKEKRSSGRIKQRVIIFFLSSGR